MQCKHCYRTEGNVETLSYDDIVAVIEQFKDLRAKYNSKHNIKRKAHINITGGEPFFREDIKEILLYLGRNREFFTYGILSNGSFIDHAVMKVLIETGVSFVQLSLDGKKEMHDSLRAVGDYDRVLKTAGLLEKNGIRTYISFTANKDNYKHLPRIAWECRKRKISKLWSDRLVPIGNGQELKKIEITKEDLPRYIKCLKKAQGNVLVRALYPKTEVAINRALQFQNSKGALYACSAGKSLITVDEFGNVMPCRRMPIICGNVFDSTLTDIYYHDSTFQSLRQNFIPKECVGCKYSYYCRGGAKCQSYSHFETFYRADPACPLANCK